MKKVAVFGKPGSGKSTLSKNLAAATGIALYPLDTIVYEANGDLVAREVFDGKHNKILATDSWLIEGFGPIDSFHARLEAADTLIYIDLPYLVSYWWVTKRLFKGVFSTPEGWPKGSSIWKGSLQGYKVLKLCPKFWNDDFLQRLEQMSSNKSLYVVRSVSELNMFIDTHIETKTCTQ